MQNRCRFVRSYGGDVIVEPASCRATAARTAPAAERAFGSPVNPEEVGPLPSTTTTRQAGEVEEGDGVGVGEGGIVECFCAARLCLSPDESGRHALDCPCFMFRFRRTNLVKRLWKARVTNQHEGQCADEACDAAAAAADELELKSVAHSLLKRLKEKQLGVLIQSLESRGGDTTECLLLSRGDLRLGRRSVAPHVLCCQIWRWPNLQADYLLKRMPCCNSAGDPTSVCCNPYHWSRLNLPGMFLSVLPAPCHSSMSTATRGGRCVLFAFDTITPVACVHTAPPSPLLPIHTLPSEVGLTGNHTGGLGGLGLFNWVLF